MLPTRLFRIASAPALRRGANIAPVLATTTTTPYYQKEEKFRPTRFFSDHKSSSTPPPRPRPFQILGLQQVAIGSLNKSGLTDLWTGIFGLNKIGSHESEAENVDEDILRIGKDGSPFAVEVDLMTPIDAEKSPKVHKPALNHIGLWVDDLPSAVQWMTEKGVRFTPGGIRPGAAGHDVTFIHPKGNDASPIGGEGVLIELVQAPPEVIRAWKA